MGYIAKPPLTAGLVPIPGWTADEQIKQFGRAFMRDTGVVNDAQRWAYRSADLDSAADLRVETDYYIDVILPDDHSMEAAPYPILFVAPVENTPESELDGLQVAKGMDVHNEYGCIMVGMTYKTDGTWYGQKNDGTWAMDRFVLETLIPFVSAVYNGSTDREDRLILGFSASGWGAYSLLLRNPTVFGYAAAWDVPWDLNYGGFNTETAFGTEDQFDAYKPKTIIAANLDAVTDKTRLWIGGGNTFNTHYGPMLIVMDGLDVPYEDEFALAGSHNWLESWMEPAVASLFAMRAA